MSRVYVSTQFYEDGHSIDLVSLALVHDLDDSELYLINADMPQGKIHKHEFLMKEVVPHLHLHDEHHAKIPQGALFSPEDPAVKPVKEIAQEVSDFFQAAGPHTVLSGLYANFDSVILARLFGPLHKRPAHVPARAREIMSDYERLGQPRLAKVKPESSNALHNARHARRIAQLLDYYDARRSMEARTYKSLREGYRKLWGYTNSVKDEGTSLSPRSFLNFLERIEGESLQDIEQWHTAVTEQNADIRDIIAPSQLTA